MNDASLNPTIAIIIGITVLVPIGIAFFLFVIHQKSLAVLAENEPDDETDALYRDKLVMITNKGLTFIGTFIPSGPKFIPFDRIERIVCLPHTILRGRYQVVRMNDWRHWVMNDPRTADRPVIFRVEISRTWKRVLFTAEDSEQVKAILAEKTTVVDRRK